jgi:rare lipoprotein A
MTRSRAAWAAWLALLAAALLAACGSAPRSDADRDGPEARPPAGLERVPDAVPRIEPVRAGGPNKPYEVAGMAYSPLVGDVAFAERGGASWYGRKFHGRPTALGEIYDMYAMTAAHRTLPLPSYVRVRNPANGREVVVRVNDRGPFVAGRVIDLSYTAALRLGLLAGVAPVEIRRITHAEIRAGLPAAAPPADDPAPQDTAAAPPNAGFWVQLGAWRQRDAAEGALARWRGEAGVLAPFVVLRSEDGVLRLQAGPHGTRAEAEAAATQWRARLGSAPLVVERH